jgi:hypothetical protein
MQFDFQIQHSNTGKASLALAFQVPAPGIRLSLADMIAGVGSGFNSPALTAFASSSGLKSAAIRIESLAVMPKPFGLRFRGTIEFLQNMTLEFIMAPTPEKKKAFVLNVKYVVCCIDLSWLILFFFP